MRILPAIDLRNGRCVRLSQGRPDQETVYDDDPARMARSFQDAGATMLHLVDLDGAFAGQSANLESIKAVRAAVDIPIELGGGLRSAEAIDGMLALGIDSVIVGTLAVREPEVLERAVERHARGGAGRFQIAGRDVGERIQLGIDARDGRVSVHGWAEDTALEAVAFARDWKAKGIARVIFTDIARDGMLQGPNLEAIAAFARGSGVRVTASGGVSRAEDVRALAALAEQGARGVDRVIIGKALYEGTIRLEDLLLEEVL